MAKFINPFTDVGFLNFHMEDTSAKLRTDVALMDMEGKTLFSDKMRKCVLCKFHSYTVRL